MITTPRNQRGKKKAIQGSMIPAPTGGIDTRYPLAKMPGETCVYAYNILPDSYGMSVRKGFKEHATKIPTVPIGGSPTGADGTKTTIVFNGTHEGTISDDRLFAVSNRGIYDITDGTRPPIHKLTFDIQTESAGNGVSCHYIDEGGHEFMLYADERNGLFTYTQATDSWAKATGITGGLAVERIAFVMVHKLRIWFVEKDTADGWYMPVNSMMGEAVKFTFGSKFAHGGYLRGLYNWSFDGGSGVDDYLVAVSSSGDVLPYKGDDPSSADSWNIVGSYYVGDLPIGRRIATEAGGQLFILSSYGLISMNDLLTGVDTRDVSADGIASKIAPMIRAHLKATKFERGWELIFAPSEGIYIINSPPRKNYPQLQYVMNISTQGWGVWRGIPMLCMSEWNGVLYFGIHDKVYRLDGYRDNVKIDQIDPGDNGLPIEFSLMTSFSHLDSPTAFKAVQFIRPDFLSEYYPSYGVKAVYDYDVNEAAISPSVGDEFDQDALWDHAIWDQAVWGTAKPSGHARLSGASGLGRTVAIAVRGTTVESLKLASIDVMWTTGGMI